MSSTAVNSFVIRFKQEQQLDQGEPPWRGFIQHVQTGQEIHFAAFQEAMHFIARYVEIEELAIVAEQGEQSVNRKP